MSGSTEPDEDLIEQFEAAWSDGVPDLDDFAAKLDGDVRTATLTELVIIDLEFRWKRFTQSGDHTRIQPLSLEDYLQRFPELDRPNCIEQLAVEEFTIRRRYGDRPMVDSFVERFPDLKELLNDADSKYPQQSSQTARSESAWPEIQNYKLLKEVGEGGMGTVYMAQQLAPVRRVVAVKVVRQGLNSSDVVARFEAERQALALMDHPHIARVYDAGTTSGGLPFFAMEYVDGIPITDYCSQHRMPVDERLRVFRDVCSAVQHAHQKGVLHRDLKPTNVLIGDQNGQPTVKVIDFGLAKAIDSEGLLTDQTVYTQAGQVLGTLKYMSPEQASTTGADVDTRADVYALGVILYELLTGTTPLDEQVLGQHGILAVLKLIQEHEPMRPSVRFMEGDRSSQIISAERSTSISSLQHQLRGDLDWVVMKALEKDRDRRYDSATSLAKDLKRFLSHDPVEARPPSVSYRIRKFSRRNRLLVSSALLVSVLLVAGIAATSWQAIRATRAETEAKFQETVAVEKAAEAERQRLVAEQARDAESIARLEAETSAQRANEILQFVTMSFSSADPMRGAKKDMRARDVLLHALATAEEHLKNDRLSQAEVCLTVAESLHGLGDDSSAIRAALKAKRLFAQVDAIERAIEANNLIAQSLLARGDAYRAWDVYSESVSQLQRLSPHAALSRADLMSSSPLMVDSLIGIAKSTVSPGSNMSELAENAARNALDAATRLHGQVHPKTIAARQTMAEALMISGNVDQAVSLFEQLLDELKSQKERSPVVLSAAELEFGRLLLDSERNERAIEVTRRAVQLTQDHFGRDHSQTVRAQCQLAETLAANHDWKEGLAVLEDLRAKANPQSPTYRRAARLFVREQLSNGDVDSAIELSRGSFADLAWIHILSNDPQAAASILSKQFAAEDEPQQQQHLLKRLVSIQLWDGKVTEVESLLKKHDSLLSGQTIPGMPAFRAVTELLLLAERAEWMLLQQRAASPEHFAENSDSRRTATDPINPGTSATPVQIALLKLLIDIAQLQSDGSNAKAIASSENSFEKLRALLPQIPDYQRWTVARTAEMTSAVFEAHGNAQAATDWKKRARAVEAEWIAVTLADPWYSTLLDQPTSP